MTIAAAEILALIQEVGQYIELQSTETQVAANTEYGIPARPRVSTRPLRGYVVPEKARWIPGEGQAIASGDWTAYVSAADLDQRGITSSTKISWDGRTYSVEYIQGIYHLGQVMLHKLRLKQTQEAQAHGYPTPPH